MSYASLKARERSRRERANYVPKRDTPDGKVAGFRARWPGVCALCGRAWKPGERIVAWSAWTFAGSERKRESDVRTYAHRACAPDRSEEVKYGSRGS